MNTTPTTPLPEANTAPDNDGKGVVSAATCSPAFSRFAYCTVYSGQSEVIVYGSGADWVIQYAEVTNAKWRRRYSTRRAAETQAEEIARYPYAGSDGICPANVSSVDTASKR